MPQLKETFHFEFVPRPAPEKPQNKTVSELIAVFGDSFPLMILQYFLLCGRS